MAIVAPILSNIVKRINFSIQFRREVTMIIKILFFFFIIFITLSLRMNDKHRCAGLAPSPISIDTVIAVKRNEGRGRELFAQITEN